MRRPPIRVGETATRCACLGHTDLDGIIFDIAAHGWVGSQKNPGAEDNIVNRNPQRRLAKFDERRARAQAKFAAMREKELAPAAE